MSDMGDPGSVASGLPDSGAKTAGICANCGAAYGPDDVFCETCGLDFLTGSMPSPAVDSGLGPDAAAGPVGIAGTANPTAGNSTAGMPTAGNSPVDSAQAVGPPVSTSHRVVIDIGIDRDYFASVVTEGEVLLPATVAADQRLELYGPELHIGRTSASRGIHPAIDVEALTGDPAVSSQHAVLRISDDGAITITDVGSTNGTFVGSFDGDPVTQGVAMELPMGLPIYLGAWTRLVIGW